MGHGEYDYSARTVRSRSLGYDTKSAQEIFSQRSINNAMTPFGVKIRESRDSAEHPNTIPIIIGLDVTGSMQSIPHFLVKQGFPNLMNNIIQNGVSDPQVLFLAIGDHTCDQAPLQVGQFESSDELLDKWLTTVWLEGKGGGNEGESYLLAWYFAGFHTSIDSFEKRGKKGILITIGDEPTLKDISVSSLKNIMGEAQAKFTYQELLNKASEKYEVYHICITSTRAGSKKETQQGWKEILQENVIFIDNQENVSETISNIVLKHTEPTKAKINVSDNMAEMKDVPKDTADVVKEMLNKGIHL